MIIKNYSINISYLACETFLLSVFVMYMHINRWTASYTFNWDLLLSLLILYYFTVMILHLDDLYQFLLVWFNATILEDYTLCIIFLIFFTSFLHLTIISTESSKIQRWYNFLWYNSGELFFITFHSWSLHNFHSFSPFFWLGCNLIQCNLIQNDDDSSDVVSIKSPPKRRPGRGTE